MELIQSHRSAYTGGEWPTYLSAELDAGFYVLTEDMYQMSCTLSRMLFRSSNAYAHRVESLAHIRHQNACGVL